MADLSKLSLKELRELYPDVKATSKKVFVELVEGSVEDIEVEVEDVSVEVAEEAVKDDIVEYIYSQALSNKKILIELETSMDADEAFAVLQFELFPKLNKENIMVVASSSRRDMSINGSCYVRLVCKNNFALVKTLARFDTFKEV